MTQITRKYRERFNDAAEEWTSGFYYALTRLDKIDTETLVELAGIMCALGAYGVRAGILHVIRTRQAVAA